MRRSDETREGVCGCFINFSLLTEASKGSNLWSVGALLGTKCALKVDVEKIAEKLLGKVGSGERVEGNS